MSCYGWYHIGDRHHIINENSSGANDVIEISNFQHTNAIHYQEASRGGFEKQALYDATQKSEMVNAV